MRTVVERLRAIHRDLPAAFWTLWVGLFVNRVATFVAAFLTPYLVRERGLAPSQAGRIVALYGIGLTVAGPLGGVLADRLGRRTTMLVALVGGAAAAAALAFVEPLPALACLTFLTSAVGDMYRPAFNAAVADLVPPVERARAYGLVYWAVNLGISAGMLVGAALATHSLRILFVVDAATSIACAGIIALRVPETRPRATVPPAVAGTVRPGRGAPGMIDVARDGTFVAFLALHLAALIVFGQWQTGLPLAMTDHGFGPSAYAVLMAMNCAGVVVIQPLLAPWLRRFEQGRLLATMALLFGLGYGINVLGGGVAVFGAGTALWTLGEVLGFPVASTLVADLAPPELRGRYQGAFSMMVGLSFTFAPIVGGELYGRAPASLWGTCLAAGVAVAAGHLLAAPARRRRLSALRGVPVRPEERAARLEGRTGMEE